MGKDFIQVDKDVFEAIPVVVAAFAASLARTLPRHTTDQYVRDFLDSNQIAERLSEGQRYQVWYQSQRALDMAYSGLA